MTIDFCLPIYNEELILKENTLKLLNFLKKQKYPWSWSLLLIVNGSSDDSFEIAKELEKEYKEIIVFNLKEGGKGRAIKHGWNQSKADYFIYMDIDLAVSLKSLPLLINNLKSGYDLVWGSRLLKSSEVKRSFLRSFSSVIYNIFSRGVLGHNFKDLQCGFKGVDNNIKNDILPCVKNNYWFFDTELIMWSKNKGYKLKEIPVHWEENRYKKRKSKINFFKEIRVFIEKSLVLRKKIKKYIKEVE